MVALPVGTVTFLFTDLEGSTRLWEGERERMPDVLVRHDAILRTAIAGQGGIVLAERGDGMDAVFASARDALVAALDFELGVARDPSGEVAGLRPRVGLHSGEGELRSDGHYVNAPLNRGARLMGIAHGGQVLVSEATATLVRDALPPGVGLVDLGAHRLRDLASPMGVFQLVHPELPGQFPRLRSLDAFPGNLPVQLSSFVGRDDEVVDIAGLLGAQRLVTLVGTGGMGKTRLALQVAAEVLPDFGDGAWLVELAKVRDPDAVVDVVVDALGVPRRTDVALLDALVEFVRLKRLLLVVDNCEHLLDATATLVRELEQSCPELVVLATSREGLGLRGERLVVVRSLPVEDAQRLFAARAGEVMARFAVTDANAGAVREVCGRLDGIPLAIELAAARTAVLSPAQIAARLDQRFALLAGGERGAIERHATLRAAIDWSYELLGPAEQYLLMRMSVFRGGCTLEAAEAVCGFSPIEEGAVFELLANLVARSLVEADSSDPDETSYRLLETIRQYGEEHVDPDDRAVTQERHAEYYGDWFVRAVAGVRGPDEFTWITRAARETENVRAAITWALAHDHDDLTFTMLESVRTPMGDMPAGRAVVEHAEAALEAARARAPEHLARMAAALAVVLTYGGLQPERVDALVNEAIALAPDDDFTIVAVLSARANRYIRAGDLEARNEEGRQLREAQRRLDDTYGIAGDLVISSGLRAVLGDDDSARIEADEALELAQRVGNPSLIARARAALANTLVRTEPAIARTQLDAISSPSALAQATDQLFLGVVQLVGARLQAPEPVLRAAARTLEIALAGTPTFVAALETTAAVLSDSMPLPAATLRGAADTMAPGLGASLGIRTPPSPTPPDPDDTAAAYGTGQAMTPDETTTYARTVIRDALDARHEITGPILDAHLEAR